MISTSWHRWLGMAGLAACQVAPRLAHRLEGHVTDSRGQPVGSALIVVTDYATHNRVAIVRSDQTGEFNVDLDGMRVSVTATAPDQFAFRENVSTLDRVELELDTHCVVANAMIEEPRPPTGAVIELGLVDDRVGDAFGAELRSDGTFAACVPEGTYYVILPEGWAMPFVRARIPSPERLVIKATSQAELDRPADHLSGFTGESRSHFVATLPDKTQVLGLGETNHGTREFSDERFELAIDLARDKSIRLLMIEADVAAMFAVDDYINGATLNIETAVQNLKLWIWDTKTFIAGLDRLRAYNSTVASGLRIHIAGFDMQHTHTAIQYLLQERLTGPIAPLLERLVPKEGAAWPELAATERVQVTDVLRDVISSGGRAGITSKSTRAALCAQELVFRLESIGISEEWPRYATRDRSMAALALSILDAESGARATIWAHLQHVSRQYLVGRPTMGEVLDRALGSRYRAYAQLAHSGEVRAWDFKHVVGVIANRLPDVKPNSLEAALAPHRVAPVTYFTFDRATGPASAWLKGVHLTHQFGAVFPPPDEVDWLTDLRQFDGAVLFERVTPTQPTATGERHAKPAF